MMMMVWNEMYVTSCVPSNLIWFMAMCLSVKCSSTFRARWITNVWQGDGNLFITFYVIPFLLPLRSFFHSLCSLASSRPMPSSKLRKQVTMRERYQFSFSSIAEVRRFCVKLKNLSSRASHASQHQQYREWNCNSIKQGEKWLQLTLDSLLFFAL